MPGSASNRGKWRRVGPRLDHDPLCAIDGFVSADVDNRGGWLLTPPLLFQGNRLRLNIDTGAMGTAFVELRDAGDKPIPGYTPADCEEVGGNYLDPPTQRLILALQLLVVAPLLLDDPALLADQLKQRFGIVAQRTRNRFQRWLAHLEQAIYIYKPQSTSQKSD